MPRGRKEESDSYNELFAIRINKSQKEVLNKNEWIKKELIKQVRNYLDLYLPEEHHRK